MKGFKINKPYRTLAVSANSSGVVWTMNVPKGHIVFIDAIASNYFSDSHFIFKIDGENVETDNINRQLGLITNPRRLNPPMMAKDSISVTAVNDSSSELTFEVLIDGTIYEDRKDGQQ